MALKSSCDAARAGPRSNTSATTRASLGRTRKPWAGELAKTPEESQVGTIAAQSVWPRLPTRMNQWMSSARIRRVAGEDRAPDQDNPQKRGPRLMKNQI